MTSHPHERGHLPACTALPLSQIWPNEPKPEHLSDYSWTEVRIAQCAEGCPVLERTLERGRELAEEHGW